MQGLPAEWPQKDSTELFIKKADGLFIWVATMCEYLVHQVSPGKHLDFLLSGTGQSESRTENKMNELYSTILNTCNWDDEDFVEGYGLLIGAILVAKIPLSASALQSIHSATLAVRVIDILQPLASVLTGLEDPVRPIQILHLSFWDFLTARTVLT